MRPGHTVLTAVSRWLSDSMAIQSHEVHVNSCLPFQDFLAMSLPFNVIAIASADHSCDFDPILRCQSSVVQSDSASSPLPSMQPSSQPWLGRSFVALQLEVADRGKAVALVALRCRVASRHHVVQRLCLRDSRRSVKSFMVS